MHIEHSDFHDQFVRGLTHKMNNILSLFHGYLGLLMDDKNLDAETQDGLRQIKDGAHAASELIDRSKALARPTSLVWREIDVKKFLRGLMPTFESLLERNSTLEVNCADELPPIWGDAARLKTAVTELVHNACEASPSGGVVSVNVSSEVRKDRSSKNDAKPMEWVSIEVSDQGSGIPDEAAGRIFDPFFTTKRRKRSVGLGLTVALGLVQQHGGSIRHVSKPGKTSFCLVLPSRSEQG